MVAAPKLAAVRVMVFVPAGTRMLSSSPVPAVPSLPSAQLAAALGSVQSNTPLRMSVSPEVAAAIASRRMV